MQDARAASNRGTTNLVALKPGFPFRTNGIYRAHAKKSFKILLGGESHPRMSLLKEFLFQ